MALKSHDWPHRLAAFAAIERLDNVDYISLKGIAESFKVSNKALFFFNVHINADHFQGILATAFRDLWEKNERLAKEVFDFVADYQLNIVAKTIRNCYEFQTKLILIY